VLLVRNAIFVLAFLNGLVMKVVSLPMYAKVAHLCVGTCVGVAAVKMKYCNVRFTWC